ncbi:MAG: hypothetical protein J0L88_14115 [Xanthomonadales bacterium]|nr:hypothetical protein [Xanthomonadales bacterium]
MFDLHSATARHGGRIDHRRAPRDHRRLRELPPPDAEGDPQPPPLLIVQAYSLPEFTTLLRAGVTRAGRDMFAQGSVMGIVAREQLAHLTDGEIASIHTYLQTGWTAERAAREEAKIATFPPPTFMKP